MSQHVSASGRERNGGLGVRAGESNPARMLAVVLVLVAIMIIMAVALVWWLA